jgi:hypothetical protein
MMRWIKRLLLLLVVFLVAATVWLTKPWDDLQSWRWFTLMFETPRAELFSHWDVI